MNSTYFATLIPNWNSLDSVRRAHSDLEAAALLFFALLVLFDVLAHLSKEDTSKTLLEKIGLWCFAVAVLAEIVAYPYGQRNDDLSAEIISSLDVKAQRASENASKALVDSSTALSRIQGASTAANDARTASAVAATEASNALTLARSARQEADSFERDIRLAKEAASEAQAKVADRKLTETQVAIIAVRLKPFAGQEFETNGYGGDPEVVEIANEVVTALNRAGWKYIPAGKGPLWPGFKGIFVNFFSGSSDSTKKSASALVQALQAQGLVTTLKENNDPANTDNKIHLNFTAKP